MDDSFENYYYLLHSQKGCFDFSDWQGKTKHVGSLMTLGKGIYILYILPIYVHSFMDECPIQPRSVYNHRKHKEFFPILGFDCLYYY